MAKQGETTTTTEAALRLGVRQDYILMLLRSGKFAGAFKQDGKWCIPVESVEARLRERRA